MWYTLGMLQTLTRKGRVVGKTIVLDAELGLPDGAPVEVEVRFQPVSSDPEQRESALQRLLSMNLPVADWQQMEEETIQASVEA